MDVSAVVKFFTTNDLVAYFDGATEIPVERLSAAIPVAIDAIYAVRDAGGVMHAAGAAAAVAALGAADLDPPPVFPYEEGDVLVLGPGVIASKDGKVISWRGQNFEPANDVAAPLETPFHDTEGRR